MSSLCNFNIEQLIPAKIQPADGGIFARPYFAAAAKAFSMSAGFMLSNCVLSETGTPISIKNFPKPAGVNQQSNFAGFVPIFVNLWT
ncbi:hypothetical protein [Nostoc sp. C052]|uniref:hypothetical protein n=1 Tax=Nostoc sp. C052 TaxID=2576902 RepID=UPI00277B4A9B|nr:hypothetical protein [Nostoc sp. C052]